jgi:hypothetical protein
LETSKGDAIMKESYLLQIIRKNQTENPERRIGIVSINPRHKDYVEDQFEKANWMVRFFEKI